MPRQSKHGWTVLITLAMLAAVHPPADATLQYVLHDLGTFGAQYARVFDMNSSGVLVGYTYAPAGGVGGFYWDGAYNDLGPGAAYGINGAGLIAGATSAGAAIWLNGLPSYAGQGGASDINERGEIAGNDGNRAFYTVSAIRHTLVPLRTTFQGASRAARLNDNGLVIGTGAAAFFPAEHALLWSNGTAQDLTPGVTYSVGQDLNDFGVAVGSFTDEFGYSHAFFWDGALHDIGKGYAGGVNNLGQIVGTDGAGRPVLWTTTLEPIPLPDLGYGGGGVVIGSSGVVAGNVIDAAGNQHAAYWTPVPEPASLLALAGLLSGAGLLRVRRREPSQ